MSFKTSPILNRLKNIKGWKQSSFPIKTSNYSRDISLNLKIYLLVKAYLVINHFKLILWQLRTHEKSTKILYVMLIHSKLRPKLKDLTTKNYLMKFSYPIYLQSNKNSLYFLYYNHLDFKRFTKYQFLTLQKKLPSFLWYNSIYLRNWTFILNTTWKKQEQEKTSNFKKLIKHFYNQLNYIGAQKILKNNKKKFSVILKQKIYFQLQKLEKEIYFFQKYTKVFKNQRWALKEKNNNFFIYIKLIFDLKNIMWKKYLSLKKLTHMYFLLKCSYFHQETKIKFFRKKQTYQYQLINFYFKRKKNRNLITFQKNSIKHYKNNQLFLRSGIDFITLNPINTYNKTLGKIHSYSNKFFFNYKIIFFIIKNYFYLLRQFNLIKLKSNNKVVVKSQIYWRYSYLTQYYFYYLNKEIYNCNGILNFTQTFIFNKFKYNLSKLLDSYYYIPIQKTTNTNRSILKNYKFSRKLWQLKTKITFFKTRFFSLLPTFLLLPKIIRWNEQKSWVHKQTKRNLHSLSLKLKRKKINNIILRQTRTNSFNFKRIKLFNKKKTYKLKNNYNRNFTNYRFSFRKNTHLVSLFVIKHQLKYILQNFLKQHLNLSFKIKILNSMNEFNTLKFYKIYFKALDKNKHQIQGQLQTQTPKIKLKKKNYITSLKKKDITFPIKSYFYLRPKNKIFFQKYSLNSLKKKNRIKSLIKQKKLKFKSQLLKKIKLKKLKIIQKFNNSLLLLKLQSSIISDDQISSKYRLIIQDKKWKEFVKRTFPILLIFRKHFDTQLLVNHIAQELEHTQTHTNILFMLRQILLIIPLKRLIAYRIIIFGRINGAKKARTISLTKGKIPLQTLTKNINFGSDYSHARVGAFGVKMWIYF